ncbi:hypothetical protein LJB97_02510, partial [Parabacteroides sp. OttesenSCG-928-O15]|nr:hypothetical protein [Parabacteroides sp. OttesenSCG-928-O15]
MNRKRVTFLMLYAMVIAFFIGCSDDDGYKDVDGQAPAIALSTDHIQTAAGRQFTIEGTVTDK